MNYSQAVHNRLGSHFVHEKAAGSQGTQGGNQHRLHSLEGRARTPGSARLTVSRHASQMDPLDSVSLATQVSQVKRLISQNCRVQSSAPPLHSFPARLSLLPAQTRANAPMQFERGDKLKTNFGPISTQWRGGCC